MSDPFRNPLVVALDMSSGVKALKFTQDIASKVGGVKIGPRLALKEGGSFISQLSELAPVFLDCKFFDIPSVMEHSIRVAYDLGVSVVTIHGLSGPESLARMAELQKELSADRPFRILAVTILTSYNDENLSTSISGTVTDSISKILLDVKKSGLNSIVCSAADLGPIKEAWPELYCLCPGIRMKDDAKGDQQRVLTPEMAINAGASSIVVGRPIVEAEDPLEKFHQFLAASVQ